MPRRLRYLPPGSVHHVVNRGNDKRILFETVHDFEQFLSLIAWAKVRTMIRIVAYCIMRNHWHLVLWPGEAGQVEAFQHLLTTTHAIRRRRLTCTVGEGHIYQDRYRAFEIWGEAHYLNVLRYVESNPLRANLVKSSAQWRWSSLYERLGHPRNILDEGPMPLPNDWVALVDTSLPPSVAEEIRSSLLKH
jgi:putative transposase